MSIRLVYVQSQSGIPASDSFFRAWEGFRKRGVRCLLFEPSQLGEGAYSLAKDTLVVGGVPVVEGALSTIGIPVPLADSLPARLAKYRGRKVWASTWGELRSRYAQSGPPNPIFVKPLRRQKSFPAVAVYDAADMPPTEQVPDSAEVLVAEYVVFVSEWRCFVRHGEIIDLCRYQGEVFRYPDPQVVRAAVSDFTPIAPAGYGIDFGVLTDGRTVLVEVNEGYSLNPYGLEAIEYSELLEARWLELTGS
jgi:hypothetical protein